MTSPAELAQLAERLADEAGRGALTARRTGRPEASTKSTATDMVTEFDRAAEQLIVSGLAAARPGDAVVGEEGAEAVGTSGITWLVDPIDGTTNFLYGLPTWAVSVAACDAHGALAGAVYVPALDEMFTAWRGGGATLNGEPIHCSSTSEAGDALVATGFSYRPERRASHASRLTTLLPQVRDVRRMGAASIDLCYVAAGRFDAYFEQWLGPWDVAAGELIAREAGCRTSDLRGRPLPTTLPPENEVLVAGPALHPALVALLAPGIM